MLLDNNVSQTRFLIRLSQPKQLYVQANSERGDVDITVYVSHQMKATQKHVWHSENSFVRISYPNETATPYLEFLVVVKSIHDKFFSVIYNQWGRCAPTNVNQPLQVDIPENSYPRCFQFYISKLAPLMVVVVDSYFDRGTGQNTIFLDWNNTKESIVRNRLTTFNTSELLKYCPGLKNYATGNYSACILNLKVEVNRATSLTLAVQYSNEEIELFDGVQVFMKSPLSKFKSMRFHYNLQENGLPILISLRSSTDTRYHMVAKIVEWRAYFESSTAAIYPLYNDETGFTADSAHTGSTALIVKPTATENTNSSSERLLLISLYSPRLEEQDAEFKIEVVQHTVPLQLSELKAGFVDKQAARKYSFKANANEELIVHVNTLVPYCAKLQLYNVFGNDESAALTQSLTNELLISPTAESKDYIVEVTGLESCSYEISYTTSEQRIYELVVGHAFSLDFKANDQVYFLYFNSRNESFRVVGMVDHGFVSYRAKSLQNQSLSDISAVVEDAKKGLRWEFGEANHDISLTIDRDSAYFCVGCYYLIEVAAEQAASVTLLLHSKSSAIPLKENRYIRETLLP